MRRSSVAALIDADPAEPAFTAGGTEADNLAIRELPRRWSPPAGVADHNRHRARSGTQHRPRARATQGWGVTLLPVGMSGIVDSGNPGVGDSSLRPWSR